VSRIVLDAAPADRARRAVAELVDDVLAQNPDADPLVVAFARQQQEALTVERLAQLLDRLGYVLALSAIPREALSGPVPA